MQLCLFNNKTKKLLPRSDSLNPLSQKSDEHKISPCNINAYSTPEVMRIKDMITQGEFHDILTTSPSTFIRKVWGQDRRICSLILAVKGLKTEVAWTPSDPICYSSFL